MLATGGAASSEAPPADERQMAKRLLIAAGLALVGVALCYVLFVRTSLGQRFDHAASLGAQQQDPRARAADQTTLSRITSDSFALFLLIVVAIGAVRRRLLLGISVAVAAGLAVILTDVLKYDILTRPSLTAQVPKGVNTFPSGHTATAVACALALVLVVPTRWKGVAAVLAGAFGWITAAQVQTAGWHRPSDAIGGALVAFAVVAGMAGALAGFRPVTVRAAGHHLVALITLGLIGGLALIFSVIGFVDVLRYLRLHVLYGSPAATTRNAAYFTGVSFTIGVVVGLLIVLLLLLGRTDLAGRQAEPTAVSRAHR